MDIKEYLNQIQRYEKVINNKLEEIEHLKLLATTIVAYFIEKVAGSGNTTNITYVNFTLPNNIRVKSTSAQTVTITAACLYK